MSDNIFIEITQPKHEKAFILNEMTQNWSKK